MGRPEGVSEDLWQSVMATARSVGDEVTFGSYEQNVMLIARTLAAWRERCVELALTERYPPYPTSLSGDEMAPFQSGADAMREKIAKSIRSRP